jgi:uncharacterized protein (TIGR03435 family)
MMYMSGKLLRFTPYLASIALCAQTQPAFDAASVRPDNGALRPSALTMKGGPGSDDPGRFTVVQMPLRMLIAKAYEIEDDQLEGPAWLGDLNRHRYTISATMPPETTKQQFQLMLQQLLAERFNLKLHTEVRSFPGYELVTLPGPAKLRTWTPAPIPDGPDPANVPGFAVDSEEFPLVARGKNICRYGGMVGATAAMKVTCRRSMADFTKDLGRFVNMANAEPAGVRVPRVVDKTGLPGIYEFRLEFMATMVRSGLPGPGPGASDPGDYSAPSLFKALEKQLNLKLVKAKDVPVTMLVVDHAEQTPSEN